MAPRIELRAVRWPEDAAALGALDTSLVTDRVYELVVDEHSFSLREAIARPPLRKAYPLADLAREIARAEWAVAAELAGAVVGLASLRLEAWNRRAILTHLYVDRAHRRSGVGRLLVEAAVAFARERCARQLWLETQNVNFPAIQFYQRVGFHLSGLDRELYDPRTAPGEVALYFARAVDD